MAITNLDSLINALANNSVTREVTKAQLHSNTGVLGTINSHWTASGVPVAGAVPVATAICTKDTLGAIPLTNPTGGAKTHVALLNMSVSIVGHDIQFHDRLGHSVFDPTIATSQTINLDISGSGSNLPARRGAADYSDVQWWIEFYLQTTSTTTMTITYTNAAGTSGRTTTVSTGGGTIRASRMFQIVGSGGEFIRSVQSVQHNAMGAGSAGVVATRSLFGSSHPNSGAQTLQDGLRLGLPRIEDDACLFSILLGGGSTLGTLTGNLKMAQG